MTIPDAVLSDKRLSGEKEPSLQGKFDSTHCLLKTYGA